MDVARARAVLTLDDSQYQQGIRKAAGQFDQMGKQVERAGKRTSENIGASLTSIAGRFAIGAALAAAGRAAISLAADYEQSLNVLGAVSGATAAQMRDLAGLAEQLGGDLSLPATSANDAALAMQELSKAGLSVSDTMGAARGTLQLAAAAGTGAARAAEVTAAALNAFKLSGDQAVKVADQLAATANSSAADITDLADAFKYAATAFAESGQSMTSLNTALGLLANAGIKGFTAGTGLRTMLASLTAPTKDATQVLQALGIQIFDNQGRMRQLRDIIDQFSRKLGPVTQQQRQWALQQIFGREAANQANIVLTQGVQKYDAMAAAVTKSGAAADLAAAKNKGLKGAFDGLTSAIQTAAVKAVRPFSDELEALVRSTARAVEWVGNRFPQAVTGAAQEINTGWTQIRDLFTSGFDGLQETADAFFNRSKQGWSGYWATLKQTVSVNVADIRNQIANIQANRTGLDKWIDRVTGKKPLPAAQMQQGAAAANKIWAGMYSDQDFKQAENQAKERLEKVGSAFPQGMADGIAKGKPKVNAALANLMKAEGQTRGVKLTDAQRQELSLAGELAGARARLGELLAGEGNIAGQVAAKFHLLSAARRGELVTVLTRIDNAEKDAESMRKFRAELDKTNASIRAMKTFHPAAILREQFRPNVTDKQLQVLQAARDTEKSLAELNKQNEEAARRRREAMERQTEAVDDARRAWQSYIAAQKYGPVNRESMSLESQWKTNYANLAPEQQATIDREFNYRMMVEMSRKAIEDLTREAERRVRVEKEGFDARMRAIEEADQRERMFADARADREKAMTEGARVLTESLSAEADRYRSAVESAAQGLQDVFGNAFFNLREGFSGFFSSIIDGFSRMLQQMAAQFLASQLVRLIGRSLGVDVGGAGGSIIGDIFGGGRAMGGPVHAGKIYPVGERGPELFLPRSSGTIIPNHQLAGAGGPPINITFNISTPDVGGFQRNERALMAQALDTAARQRRRDGG